jgi:hypothetical protein
LTPRLLLPLALLAVAGCDGGHDEVVYIDDYESLCDSGVVTADIDRAAFLELDPGYYAQASVEYAGDGFWRVAVSCDTAVSGYRCFWDLLVSPIDAPLDSAETEGLEPDDGAAIVSRAPGVEAVHFTTETAFDVDAFTLATEPGAGLRVDALLDDACAGPYLSWSEHGVVVGSPTQVTELYPVEP